MKKTRLLGVVAVVAAVLLVAVLAPGLFPGKEEDAPAVTETQQPSTRVKLVDLDLSTIRSLSIDYPSGTGSDSFTLLPIEGSDQVAFQVQGRPDISLMDGVAETILFSTAILSADGEGIFNDVSEEDLAGFGFSESSPTCTITAGDGSVTVTRGGYNPDGTGRYVMRTGDPTVYLVQSLLVDGIFPTLYDIRNKMINPIDPQQFAGMRLSQGDEILYDIRLYTSDDPFDSKLFSFFAVRPFSPPKGVDDYRLDEVLKPMAEGVVVERFIDDPEDLAAYELDADQGRRITIYGPERITLDLLVGADADDGGSVYTIFPGTASPVMVMPKAALAVADTDALYLVEKFASLVGIDTIDEFRIRVGTESWRGGVTRESQEGVEEPVESFWFLDRDAPEELFKDLYQVIIGLQIEGIADPGLVADSSESLMQIVYLLRDRPDVVRTIDLYQYDKDFAILSVDGGTRFFLMGLYQIDHVAEQARKLESVVMK